jgi:glycine cleavage system aminomethyltransferase T
LDFRGKSAFLKNIKKPKIKTVGLVISPSSLLLGNEKLLINGKVSGLIRSFARSKWLKKTIAIAHVELKYASVGQEFSVGDDSFSTREKIVAKVCSRRFYNQLI